MIRLCNFCLRKLQELDATILPKDEGQEPRSFVVTLKRLYPYFDTATQKQTLSVELLADSDLYQQDIDAIDQYACHECKHVLSNNVQCYVFRGTQVEPDGDQDDMPDGAVMVVTLGRFSRFDIPTVDAVRAAVAGMIEFASDGGGGSLFEW